MRVALLVALLAAAWAHSHGEECCRCCPARGRQLTHEGAPHPPVLHNLDPYSWQMDSAGHLVPSAGRSIGPLGANGKMLAKKLIEEFSPDYIALYGKGPGDDYFELFIVDGAFSGLNTLKKQRLVFSAIREEVKLVHAFSINAYAPDSPQAAELMGHPNCGVQEACDDGTGRRLDECLPSHMCGVGSERGDGRERDGGGNWVPWGLRKWQELDDRRSAAPRDSVETKLAKLAAEAAEAANLAVKELAQEVAAANAAQEVSGEIAWRSVAGGVGIGLSAVAVGVFVRLSLKRRQGRAAIRHEERNRQQAAVRSASAHMDTEIVPRPASADAVMSN